MGFLSDLFLDPYYLFNMYKFVSILFADDTTILFERPNIDSIVTSLNYDLGKLIICLNANKLSINVY